MKDRSIKSGLGVFGCLSSTVCCFVAFVDSGNTVVDAATDPPTQVVPPEIANQPPDHRSAHVHNADRSCCKPCVPTEADEDPDVFKRPCFARALGKSRQPTRWFLVGLTGREGGIKLSEELIPVPYLEGFQGLLSGVLHADYLPRAWHNVEFDARMSCPLKTISEVRNGVKTFVRQEFDCTEEVTELKDDEDVAIQVEWRIGDIDVLPRVRCEGKPPRKAVIRLRLYGSERLELRPRPPDFRPGGDRMNERWDFFGRAAFHALLVKVFHLPFETPGGFLVGGRDTKYEGVRVFHGTIRSRDWESHRRGPNAPRNPQHWWDEMRLLVTDSDPQYFCVSVVLREMDIP